MGGFRGYTSPPLIPVRVYQKKTHRIGGWRGSCDTGRAEWQETRYWVHPTIGDIYKIEIEDNINGLTYSYEMADNGDVTEDTFPPGDPINQAEWFEPFESPFCGQHHGVATTETQQLDGWSFICNENPVCTVLSEEECECEARYWENTFDNTTLEDMVLVEDSYGKAVEAKDQVSIVGNHSVTTEDILTFADTVTDTDLIHAGDRTFRVSKVRTPDGLRFVIQNTGTYPVDHFVYADAPPNEDIIGALHTGNWPDAYFYGHASKLKVASRIEVFGEDPVAQIYVNRSIYFDYVDSPNHNYVQVTRHNQWASELVPTVTLAAYLVPGGESPVGHSCTSELHPCLGLFYFDSGDAPQYGTVFAQSACGLLADSPPVFVTRVGGPKKIGPRRTGPG